jgi:hypothetical protein
MKQRIQFLGLCFLCFGANVKAGDVIVIGNANVPKMDVETVQKIYTGKFITVNGINVTPVSLKAGSTLRNVFLATFLNQDEEKYTGYWTVRRYVGKGTPPLELNDSEEMIHFINTTAGALGYIDETDLKENMNVVARKK